MLAVASTRQDLTRHARIIAFNKLPLLWLVVHRRHRALAGESSSSFKKWKAKTKSGLMCIRSNRRVTLMRV